ncbi:exodeoxyribonuclease III [Cyclobacterium plantarum]|uniref:Exodeoxyribonuclease III n=1 Tax=Cyclobacterium plantarum TaxID=2716263 RepID=A0ABX0HG51_9BACT|nr:exodeoxyribonuclease III [Cyclobacterium plantarum]NHE59283.1 exodeoxyribonuclease III [Cyclobacterium plantarum]
MKIITYNVNGIRAAIKKGFVDWLKIADPDIIGLQEIKSLENQIDTTMFKDLGYHVYWYPAVKKGYSGVAILSKNPADKVKYGMGIDAYDDEGRIIQADYKDFTFISAYFPSGTTGDIRQDFKYRFLDDIYHYTQDLLKGYPDLILSGDYNICHKAIDIHNPISNKNTSGFLPEERQWMDNLTSSGLDDSFRLLNKEPHQYSWWSYRANARANNKGWRIDYHMTSPSISKQVKEVNILQQVHHSDHCPVSLSL